MGMFLSTRKILLRVMVLILLIQQMVLILQIPPILPIQLKTQQHVKHPSSITHQPANVKYVHKLCQVVLVVQIQHHVSNVLQGIISIAVVVVRAVCQVIYQVVPRVLIKLLVHRLCRGFI
jgi:hypothetical protein